MAEIRNIIDHKTIQYEGIFSVNELYDTLKNWQNEKGYVQQELQNFESIKDKGKEIYLKLEPYKEATDYIKFMIRVQVNMENVVDVDVKQNEITKRMNKGNVTIIIDGLLVTDYENKWEQRPIYVFMRTLYDKFFFKVYTDKYIEILKEDTENMISTLKSFLNLYKFE
jgi:hypothetical protein